MDLLPELWGLSISSEGHLMIGGGDTVELAHEYGTPVYVINEIRLQENFDNFLRAFKSRLGKRRNTRI